MDDNPLQLALQQLAKTMGVALPTTGLTLQQDVSSNEQTKNTQIKVGDAIPKAEETEEGELSDNELPLEKTDVKKRLSNKTDLKRKKALQKESKEGNSSLTKRRRNEQGPVKQEVEAKPKVPCRYWMEGKCSKGGECTFSHAIRPNKTVDEAKSEEVCKFHIAGNCLKGDSCMYSHDLSKVPCKFFHVKTECSASENCRFSHAPISEGLRHQLFAEMMGSRDPRLAATVETKSNIGVPSRVMTPPTVIIPPNFFLDPEVARYNPFGSPF